MRYSVEGRVPFAARSVVKLAARIPYSQLVTSNSLKYLLRGAFEHQLPENIIKRPKHGFNIPIDHWLKTQWADMVEDIRAFLKVEPTGLSVKKLADRSKTDGTK